MLWLPLSVLPTVFSQPTNYKQNSYKAKASVIFKNTQDIEAVRRLLGHQSVANISKYLGVENEDALELAMGIQIWWRKNVPEKSL